jgi:multiple sugar transport system substrate-binding protein
MKTFLKTILLAVSLVLATGTLFAGGGSQGRGDAGKQVTIVVGGWPSGDVGFKAALPGFYEKYPNIKVELEFMETADYQQALTTALAAGNNAPDVAAINDQYIGQYKDTPVLEDLLRPPYNAGKYQNDMAAFKWNNCVSSDGKSLRAIPWDIAPACTFYRADVWESAGLPSDPESVARQLSTWQGVLEAAEKISIPGKCWFVADAMYIYDVLWMNRDYFDKDLNFLIDRPSDIEALKVAAEIRKNKWDMNVKINAPEANAAQANGALGIVTRGCWHGGFLKSGIDPTNGNGKWRVVELPGSVPRANSGGSYISIPSQGKNKEAAWAFTEYMVATIKGQNDIFQAVDYFPAYKPAWSDPIYQYEDPYFGGQKTRALWANIAADVKPVFPTIMEATVNTIMYNSINASLDKGLSPDQIKAQFVKDVAEGTAELRRQQIQVLRDAGVWSGRE